jgi:hypothetical protein
MIRKVLLALGTAAALAISVPTVADAAHFGGGHFGGGHFGGGRGFGGGGFGFGFGIGAPYAFAGPYDYGYGGYGCRELRRVWTPFGWRWHRVWVC